LTTARRFENHPGVFVALTTDDVWEKLDSIRSWTAPARLPAEASPELLDAVRSFLQGGT
jgi:hypothetical protein